MNGQGGGDVTESAPNSNLMGRSDHSGEASNAGGVFGDGNTTDAALIAALCGAFTGGLTLGDPSHQDDGRNHQINTTQQIQELEKFFEKCPHPNEEQTIELGRRLELDANQVELWFHNKRTQVKLLEIEHEKITLLREREKLLEEQERIKQALKICPCNVCGVQTDVGLDIYLERKLREENAKLRHEIEELISGDETISMLLDVAKLAMEELTTLAKPESPFWVIDPNTNRETLNFEEFRRVHNNGMQPHGGYALEASRETGVVLKDCLALVNLFTDTSKWVEALGCIVSKAMPYKLIPNSPSGDSNGSLQLIEAEFQVISPLVPIRRVEFVRYCEMIRKGLWVVVDVTAPQTFANPLSHGCANRLSSGLLIEDMENGCSKVTWIEQAEYDESHIHQTYRLLVSSGLGFGAKRWLTTLQRHYESLSTLASINMAEVYQGRVSSQSGTEMMKLANRMTISYYSAVSSGYSDRNWERVHAENEHEDMRLMVRKSENELGEHTGIVLSVATSVWCSENQHTVFGFLSNKSLRSQWDILTGNTFTVETKIHIPKANSPSNNISLLQVNDNMQVLQESWSDESGAMLVYAPVDVDSVEKVMRGEEEADRTPILPSGFSISPEGASGCLLTIGFQLLLSSRPAAEVKKDDVELAVKLITSTVGKIKSALFLQPA